MDSIFKPNIGKKSNNKKVYYSFLNDQDQVIKNREKVDPLSFINKLKNNGAYIFSKSVIIKTKNKTYDTKIAGTRGGKIITLNNDVINIDDVLDIYEK